MSQTKSQNSSRRKVSKKVIIILVLLVLLSSAAYVVYNRQSNQTQPSEPDDSSVNYSPPSKQEQSAGDDLKDDLSEDDPGQSQTTQTTPTPEKEEVTVIITDAEQYDDIIEVRSFIPDYYQDGNCTITFRKGSQTVTKNAPAYADSSTTVCTNPEIKNTEFPTYGNWEVTVIYESEGAKGTSDPQNVKVY